MSAPELLWVDWTPVDEIDIPTAMSAYTPKAAEIAGQHISDRSTDFDLGWNTGAQNIADEIRATVEAQP